MSAVDMAAALVALQRGAELCWSGCNTRRLRRRGAVEIDAAGYPWFVALHLGWLASLVVLVPPDAAPSLLPLILYALLQPARLWAMASLGCYWTTRIMTLRGVRLVDRGPYRWLRHPSYLIVAAEIALLPLAFRAVTIAIVFSALNLVLIARRIAIEERALAPRRRL